MRQIIIILTVLFNFSSASSQESNIDRTKVREDFNQIIENIKNLYVYLDDKELNMNCIEEKYVAKIDTLKNQADVILFFEYLLNEFYDSHISLSTNIRESYRLSAPIYIELKNGKAFIKNVWQTQIDNLDENILGAEILKFNGVDFIKKIDDFPSICNDKTLPEVRNWIANKIVSGKYSEPRLLSLKVEDGQNVQLDLDKLNFKKESELLSYRIENGIGIIRINNSLGNNQLISEFDKTLDSLFYTKGLIIDLRNTNNGGNTYVGKGIMGRFTDKELPYQKHMYVESYDNQPKIVRSWFEHVSPRGNQYQKPVIILVGRWTGSMGEGIAIGFDAMERAEIVGTEMKRLAGSDFDFRFENQGFGYKLILQKLYHINGNPRELYVPTNYVKQSTIKKDEVLEKGTELINKMVK
ncbi:carboxyl-terminal processing protease [Polaribacter sp. Hel1_33_78]|nr:carboxyl-terminal processing protease [Polaribacter sp. Hel1_33_78]